MFKICISSLEGPKLVRKKGKMEGREKQKDERKKLTE
jgi:hypothetical protein